RRTNQSSGGIAGGFQAQFSRRVGIKQVVFEDTVSDDDGAPGRQALRIKRPGSELAGHFSVVHDRQTVRRDSFVELAHKKTSFPKDRLSRDRLEDVAEQFAGEGRLEYYRDGLGLDRASAQLSQSSAGSGRADLLRALELAKLSPDVVPVIPLHPLAVA